jgi:predicted secreted protein
VRGLRGALVAAVGLGIAAALVVGGCAAPVVPANPRVQLDQAADGSSVQLTRGQELVVELPSNRTTGYDWYLSGALPSQLTTASDTYETTSEPGVVGAGGTHVFTYTVAAAGSGTLKLVYVRPWETGVRPAKTFAVTITVR